MVNLLAGELTNPVYLYVLGLVVFLWFLILRFALIYLLRHYRRLTKGVTGSDLRSVWMDHLLRIDKAQKEVEVLKTTLNEMKDRDRKHLQKQSLVRFNPFSDTGGNQSFVIALLDDLGDGFVLSSLHSREGTRVYAKSIKEYRGGDHELSTEEVEAVSYARRS